MTSIHPESWIYLHAAVQQQVAKLKDKRFRASASPARLKFERERCQELLKRWKKQCGRVWWVLVAITVIADASIFVLMVLHPPGTTYIYTAPQDTWRVLEELTPSEEAAKQAGGWEFMLQNVHNGVALPAMFRRFCLDPKPRIQVGFTLTYFAFDDMGDCISIKPKDRWYQIERGADHWPTLPKNCKNLGLGKPVVCDGLPDWSK